MKIILIAALFFSAPKPKSVTCIRYNYSADNKLISIDTIGTRKVTDAELKAWIKEVQKGSNDMIIFKTGK